MSEPHLRADHVGSTSRGPERMALWGIVACAALVRLVYASIPRVVRWDEAGHLLVARSLASGRGYSELAGTVDVHLPPVLPMLSALLLKMGMAPEWATATIHIVTGALLCLPIYALAREGFSRRAGLMAALLVAVYPALAAWPLTWSTMTESPFLLCVFSGVWAAWRALQTASWRWYGATGILFGLAYLTRPEGLTYFAVIGLYMVLWQASRRALLRWDSIARLALAVVCCVAVMGPYLIFLHRATGHWVLSGKVGLILDISPAYLAHDQAAHDLAVSRLDSSGEEIMWFSPERFERSLSAYVLENPRRFFYQVRQNMAETWSALFHQDLLSPWVVAAAALGMFGRRWSRRRWWFEGLLWATALPLVSFWVFFVISRFLIGALPLALLWAAAGLDHLARWAVAAFRERQGHPAGVGERRGLGVRLASALPVVAALTFCLWVTPGRLSAQINAMPWTHVEAARWLSVEAPEDAVIMTRHTEIGLYASRQSIACPNADWDDVLAYGRARGASYLVVDAWEVTDLRPQLSMLADPLTIPTDVELLRTFEGANRTWVFRIVDAPAGSG